MTDPNQYQQQPQIVQPANVVQVTGRVAENVVSGLKTQPALLALVILNCVAIGLATWYLVKLAEGNRDTLQALIARCQPLETGNSVNKGNYSQ